MSRIPIRIRCNPKGRLALLALLVATGLPVAFARAPQPDAATAAAGYDWLQFGAANTQETTLSAANVGNLRRTFRTQLPNITDDAPVYLRAVNTPSGVRDLVFLTMQSGKLAAYDAHTGTQIWLAPTQNASCTVPQGYQCITNSTPVIDPGRQYIYSVNLDGYVHKYAVGTGTEITGNGWPELATLKPSVEKFSSSLKIYTARSGVSYLYVQTASNGDEGDYEGHLTTTNLTTGSQHVFNTLCSNQVDVHFVLAPGTPDCSVPGSGLWARAGAVYDPDTDRVYITTGNVPDAPPAFVPANGTWGLSVLALNPNGTGLNGTGTPVDSYTPANWPTLDFNDWDMASSSPASLPVSANSRYQHLALQADKDGFLRLLDMDDLSEQGGPGHTGGEVAMVALPQSNYVRSDPAVWVNPADGSTWMFITSDMPINASTTHVDVEGWKLTIDGSGMPGLQLMWTTTPGGGNPLIANGVLYIAGTNALRALDPLTGHVLWQDTSLGNIHWQSPIIANGMLYVTEGYHSTAYLDAYALSVAGPTSTPGTPTSTATPSPTSTSTATPRPTNTPGPSLSYFKEAEALPTVGHPSKYADSAASGGYAIKAWSNGDGITDSVSVPSNGTYAFSFGGREDHYAGTDGADAHVSLYLDGSTAPASGVYVTNTSGYATYTVHVPLTAGTHTYKLAFDNDAYGGTSATDRNAYVDRVSIKGTDYAAEAEAITAVQHPSRFTDTQSSGGYAMRAWSNGDGVAQEVSVPSNGTYAFNFGGREDYYAGADNAHAHVSLYLDGLTTPAGGVSVTSARGYPSYTIQIPLTAGAHAFSLLFDNDAYGGTPTTDRNAYIDWVDVVGP